MKMKESINQVDSLKPNAIDEADKVKWINDIELIIFTEILDRAEDNTAVYKEYQYQVDDETDLLVGNPYTDIYFYYLSAKIDAINGEVANYNNDMSLFNAYYDNFAAYYRRNHMPKQAI